MDTGLRREMRSQKKLEPRSDAIGTEKAREAEIAMSRICNNRRAALVMALPLLTVGLAAAHAQDAADIEQIEGVQGSIARVLQQGAGNNAEVHQRAAASAMAASQNHAVISQFGDGNNAGILQDGSANSAAIAQNGSNNDAVIQQQNAGNSAELQQSGNGLAIKIEQFGAGTPGSAPITVIQAN